MQPGPTKDDQTTPWRRRSWPETTEAPVRAEAVVIGAGVAGLTAALGLAARGASVAIVDPGSGAGAAERGTGMVLSGLGEHPARLAHALGDERTAALLGLCRSSVALLEEIAPVIRCEQVWVATTRAEAAWVERSVEGLARLGFPVRPLGPGGLAERAIRGECGFSLEGDALVDPGEVLSALAARAADRGVAFVRGRVGAVEAASGGLAVRLEGCSIGAEVVVWAAGADCGEPSLRDQLWPVREQAAVLALPDGAVLAPVVGRAGHGWTGFRPVAGDRVLVTGCRWATPHLEVGERRAELVPAVQDKLLDFAGRHLGAVGPALARWAWVAAHGCDGLPLVGPLPGDSRRLVCAGFGSNDWGLGPACAELLVEGLVGEAAAPLPWLAPSRMG